MAKEYIDKETVCEDAKTWFQKSDMKLYNDCVQMVRDRVTALPAADVRENVRAHWYDVGSLSCRCSACGCKSNRETAFCPNCGAQMGGAEDG